MMFSLEGVSLDGGRYFTPTPKTDCISLNKYHSCVLKFKYYIKNSIEYIIHKFYYHPDSDDETIAHDKFMECVLVFESDIEKESFKVFLMQNWKNKQEYSEGIFMPYFETVKGYNMDVFKEEFYNSQLIKKMLISFRGKKENEVRTS